MPLPPSLPTFADTPDEAAPNQRNWHYPLNFEGTVGDGRSRRNRLNRTASRGSDRFERTRIARAGSAGSADSGSTYPPRAATDDDVPVWGRDYGRQRRSSRGSSNSGGGGGGGASGGGSSGNGNGNGSARRANDPDAVFNHEF